MFLSNVTFLPLLVLLPIRQWPPGPPLNHCFSTEFHEHVLSEVSMNVKLSPNVHDCSKRSMYWKGFGSTGPFTEHSWTVQLWSEPTHPLFHPENPHHDQDPRHPEIRNPHPNLPHFRHPPHHEPLPGHQFQPIKFYNDCSQKPVCFIKKIKYP